MLEFTNFENKLNEELKEIESQIKLLEESLKKAPSGKLNIFTKGRAKPLFYVNEKGIRQNLKDETKVKMLAQKSYDMELLKLLEKRHSYISKVLDEYRKESIQSIYDSMTDLRKQLVEPIIITDEEYVEQWYSNHPGSQNPFPNKNPYDSLKKEIVRSKSEKIIADMFCVKGVIYIYEPKLVFKDGTYLYPDFLILNLRLRKVIVFEHFGRMSDGKYNEDVCKKMLIYQKNGFVQGDTLFFTMESDVDHLDINILETIIDKYLL